MRQLKIVPDGWECTVADCPPGFFVDGEELCFKTEYGECECFCASGETYCADRKKIIQPVKTEWVEED